jgi:hypothetical protein
MRLVIALATTVIMSATAFAEPNAACSNLLASRTLVPAQLTAIGAFSDAVLMHFD